MKVVDIFCGAGGLSSGLQQAGLQIIAGVDQDTDSMNTFAYSHANSIALCQDAVTAVDGDLQIFKSSRLQSDVSILVGGPPCQGFCSINPGRHIDDPRNSCVDMFLYACAKLNPDFVLIENVPGLISLSRGFAIEKIKNSLTLLGYFVNYMILQAAHYGAPQNRWRLIITGSKKADFRFPVPTHFSNMKPNISGGRSLTFRTNDDANLFESYKPTNTVWDAISDLPVLTNGGGFLEGQYTSNPKNEFQEQVRLGSSKLFNHQSQKLGELNLQRIKCIKEGENWQVLPSELVPQNIKRSAEKWGRFTPTRFGRLKKSAQFTTILTKPEPYWGSFIHPTQDRLISAREAARAQCFPDNVRFFGNLSSQYRQIGNAVPLAIGRALGLAIQEHFSE